MVSDIVTRIMEPVKAKDSKCSSVELIDNLDLGGYAVSASFKCKTNSEPSEYVARLVELGYFENITYSGYSADEKT